MRKTIYISAGEASGDMHAAGIVRALKQTHPELAFYGMGGKLMQEAGVNLIVNSKELALIGAVKILTNFFKIFSAFYAMRKAIYKHKPDLVILVDYPGFNLRLAKTAKKAGCKVLYYISPKVWAWHQSRVLTIKKYVDTMAVIFPFEVEFYKQWQIPVVFVGNPLTDTVKTTQTPENFKHESNLSLTAKTIGLLPGSRKGEIERLFPVMLEAAKILAKNLGDVQFVLPLASSLTRENLAPYLSNTTLKIKLITNNTYNAVNSCDAAIVASGTATLETALLAVPMVIIYKTSSIEACIIRRIIKINFVGLCNILAGKQVAKELLQNDATPENIATEITQLLLDPDYRKETIEQLQQVKASLQGEAKQNIASVALGMLG